MNTNNTNFILTYTEELLNELYDQIRSVKTGLHFVLDLGFLDHNDSDVIINDDEEERLENLIINFSNECRDNYLRNVSEGQIRRYRYLLKDYFDFLPVEKKKIEAQINDYCEQVMPTDTEDRGDFHRVIEKWNEENENTYHFRLCRWANNVTVKLISDVIEIVDQYDSYMANALGQELGLSLFGSTSANQEFELVTPSIVSKGNRKKGNISLKKQMILLDTLGFLKAEVWGSVNTTDKAYLLSQLLNRSEQEVRSMLTYWEGIKPPFDYDCTRADDNDAVTDMVFGKGLIV